MKRAAFFLLLLAAVPGTASSEWPDWAERWLWNGGERTDRAIETLRGGNAEEAVASLETALRLEGKDPVALYNAGTGRLATGLGDPAAPLAAAAASGQADLAPSAHYNLGNLRMGQEDYSGAIEAYKRALKAAPGFADAKFNLELARRKLAEQQPPPPQEEQDPESQQDEPQQQQEEEQQEPPPPPRQEEQDEGQDEFRDLPDMTEEEAAAILEAVENMERERRRKEVLEAAKKNASGKKDW